MTFDHSVIQFLLTGNCNENNLATVFVLFVSLTFDKYKTSATRTNHKTFALVTEVSGTDSSHRQISKGGKIHKTHFLASQFKTLKAYIFVQQILMPCNKGKQQTHSNQWYLQLQN